jgi:hypothetical protein
MRIAHALATLVLLLVTQPAFADTREDTARKALVGDNGKAWVHVAIRVFMGPDEKCSQGEVWTFRPEHVVDIRQCTDGKLTSQSTTWRLHSISSLDMGLEIGGRGEFLLLMPELGNGTKKDTMILRVPGHGKPDSTQDLEFRYEKGP